jgi:arylsulfatase
MVFNRPPTVAPRNRYRYWPDRAPVPESVAANVRNRPHAVTAHVTVPPSGRVEGVLVVQGSVLGGWSLHVVNNRLVYVHNLAGWRVYRVEAELPLLSPGAHTFGMRFEQPGVQLLVDGTVIGEGVVKRTIWSRFSLTGAGLTVGWSPDFSPADEDYRGAFRFTGTLHHVDVDVDGLAPIDREAEVNDIVASQ